MKFEEIVAPLNLCKKIPAGEFENSAFCWHYTDVAGFVCRTSGCEQVQGKAWQIVHNHPRKIEIRRKHGEEIYPAPTLQEIMAELPPTDSCVGYFCIYQGDNEWSIGVCELDLYVKNGTESSNPAVSALKVWLKHKGIEVINNEK